MTRYKLTNTKNGEIVGYFATRQDAANEMENYITLENNDFCPTDKEWLTPFDFNLEKVEIKTEPNEVVSNYIAAREYLGSSTNNQFIRLAYDINPSHAKALNALNELFTIAEAWNKIDNFVPDFSNRRQDKWFPWFVYDPDRASFVSAHTSKMPSNVNAYIGFRLCFKTENRARQFGNQFINLWNKVLLP